MTYTRADLERVANAAAAKAAAVQRATCRELLARIAAKATGRAKLHLSRAIAAIDALPTIEGVNLAPERPALHAVADPPKH